MEPIEVKHLVNRYSADLDEVHRTFIESYLVEAGITPSNREATIDLVIALAKCGANLTSEDRRNIMEALITKLSNIIESPEVASNRILQKESGASNAILKFNKAETILQLIGFNEKPDRWLAPFRNDAILERSLFTICALALYYASASSESASSSMLLVNNSFIPSYVKERISKKWLDQLQSTRNKSIRHHQLDSTNAPEVNESELGIQETISKGGTVKNGAQDKGFAAELKNPPKITVPGFPSSSTKPSSSSSRRMQMERKQVMALKDEGIRLCKDTERMWLIEIDGAKNTLYENETYTISVTFDESYPFVAPKVVFVDKPPIHPHIYSNGLICLNILYEGWTPALSISAVCISLVSMLSSCVAKQRPPDDNFLSFDSHFRLSGSPRFYFHDDNV